MSDQTQDPTENTPPQRKGRSPSYPGIDLEFAIQRAEQLWQHEHHYPTAVPTILGHWGYGTKSGGGFAAIAALKNFGLMDDQGTGPDRTAWLTKLAQDILTAESKEQRQALIRQAALKPSMHLALWEKYGSRLPSDVSMQLFLTREREFTPSGAGELVSEWKRTLAYAKLADEAGSVTPNGADAKQDSPEDQREGGAPAMTPAPPIAAEPAPQVSHKGSAPPRAEQRPQTSPPSAAVPHGQPSERTQRTIHVPYGPDQWALLQVEAPLTAREWANMISSLQALKVGFVADE